jgi:Carboxypeptidase regulatory-like domain
MGVGLKIGLAMSILVLSTARAQSRPGTVKISGRLVNQAGEPIPNAVVRVVGSGGHGWGSQTDRFGAFEFRGVMPDTYEVRIQLPGFKLATVRAGATENDADIGTVVLEIAPIIDVVTVEVPDVRTNDPITTTLCELLKSPLQFHGKLVQIRARVNPPGIDTEPFFVDYACSAWVAMGTALEPLERTYLNYLFERYVGERRGFDTTVIGRFELQLVLSGQPAPYLRLQNVLDISGAQVRPTITRPRKHAR